MKKLILLISLFWGIFSLQNTKSQGLTWNFGIKLGSQSGADDGFVFGLESSLVLRKADNYDIKSFKEFGGLVLAWEKCNKTSTWHWGVEFGYSAIGVDLGPSYRSKEGEKNTGITLNLFTSAYIIPYYGITYYSKIKETNTQYGIYAKVPLPFQAMSISD